MKKIRILIADDHAILRTGLRMLIEAQPDMAVVAEASDGEEAVQRVGQTAVDVAIVDLTMPGMSGVDAIARIRKERTSTRVLVLTMHDGPAYARATLAAGASGHLIKDVDGAELLAAIRAVDRGRTFVQFTQHAEAVEDAVRAVVAAPSRDGTPPPLLSARERQVLELLAHGFTNREVASRLALSVKTVETYRGRLVEKLGLQSRADLVRFALDLGLLTSRQNPGR